jgi:hypothetical protein
MQLPARFISSYEIYKCPTEFIYEDVLSYTLRPPDTLNDENRHNFSIVHKNLGGKGYLSYSKSVRSKIPKIESNAEQNITEAVHNNSAVSPGMSTTAVSILPEFIVGKKYMLPNKYIHTSEGYLYTPPKKSEDIHSGRVYKPPTNKLGKFLEKITVPAKPGHQSFDSYRYIFENGELNSFGNKNILHEIIPDNSAEGGRRSRRRKNKKGRKTRQRKRA